MKQEQINRIVRLANMTGKDVIQELDATGEVELVLYDIPNPDQAVTEEWKEQQAHNQRVADDIRALMQKSGKEMLLYLLNHHKLCLQWDVPFSTSVPPVSEQVDQEMERLIKTWKQKEQSEQKAQ